MSQRFSAAAAQMRLLHGRAVIALTTLLAACDAGPSGIYKDDGGMMGIDFKSGDKVVMLEFGQPKETRSYVIKGDRVLIDMGNGNMEFRMEEGRLHGPFGMTLRAAK